MVLGPGPAMEELWDEVKERRGEDYVGVMEMGNHWLGFGGRDGEAAEF